MAAGDNRLGLIFEIGTQGTEKSEAQIKELGSVSEQLLTAQQAALKKLGIAYGNLETSAQIAMRKVGEATKNQQGFLDELNAAVQRNIEATRARAAAESRTAKQIEEEYLGQAAAQREVAAATAQATEAQELGNATTEEYAQNYARLNEEAETAASGGIYQSIQGMRQFRTIFAATVGLVSFGFWITEWSRVAQYIADAASSLGGFDAALREAVALAAKWNDAMIQDLGKLSVQQLQILAGIHNAQQRQRQEAQFRAEDAQQELNALQKKSQHLQHEVELIEAIRAAQKEAMTEGMAAVPGVPGNDAMSRLMQLSAQAKKEGIDTGQDLKKLEDEIQATQIKVIDQGRAVAQMKLNLVSATDKEATAEDRLAKKRETAAQRAAAAAERAAKQKELAQERAERAAVVAFQKEYRAGQEFADKLARSFEKAYDARQRAEAKAATDLARGPQGAKGGVPGVAGAHDAIAQAAINAVPPLTKERQAVLALNDALTGTTTSLQHVSGEMGVAVQFQQRFGQAMGSNIAQAIVYGQSISKAMESALKATLASISAQAMVRAIFETAVGFADLFVYPPAAAAAFESAAIFASIGGVTAGLGAAIPGGGGRRGGSRHLASSGGSGSHYAGGSGGSSSGASGQQLVPGGNLPAAPKNGNLTISIMGDQEAGQWLANTLNTVVQQGGAELTATRTTAIPNPVA